MRFTDSLHRSTTGTEPGYTMCSTGGTDFGGIHDYTMYSAAVRAASLAAENFRDIAQSGTHFPLLPFLEIEDLLCSQITQSIVSLLSS